LVGEISDGWITTSRSSNVPDGLPRIETSARLSGNSFGKSGGKGTKPYVTVLTSACVLRENETILSERVLRNVGPTLIPGVHAMWESAFGPGSDLGMADAEIANRYNKYITNYGNSKSERTEDDRRYLDVHEGHYVYLKEGEEQFVSPNLLARTLTGTGAEINDRLDELESIGVNNVALSVVDRNAALDLITDFSEQIIKKRR